MATKEEAVSIKELEKDIAWRKSVIESRKEYKADYQQKQMEAEVEVRRLKSLLTETTDERRIGLRRRILEADIQRKEDVIKRYKENVQQWEERINSDESQLQSLNKTKDKAIKEKAIKEMKEQERINACDRAMKNSGSVEQILIQGLLFGFPRSGKSSLKDRLAGKLRISKGSTGAAERVAHVEITMCQISSGWNWKELEDPNSETAAVVGKVHLSSPSSPATQPSASEPPSASSRNTIPPEKTSFFASIFRKMVKKLPQRIPQHARTLEVISSSLQNFNLEELESYMEDTWTLYMSDTGGQPEFQELLPVLVSGPALFFLVFRLDKDLHQKYTMEYLHPETGKSVVPFEGSFSMAEMILQSLASIASTRMQSFVENLTPKIVFVGTHKDQLKSQEEISKVDEELQRIVKTTDAFGEGMVVFASESQLLHAVDNTSKDDSDFQKVRTTVEKIAQSPFYRIQTPFSWLMLGILLSRSEKRVMSYDECLENGRECGIKTAAELDHALWFLHHRVGIIRHFQSVPALQHVIIKDPQYIFDKVTELIVDTFTFEKTTMNSNTFEEFQKRGIFPLSVFKQLFQTDCGIFKSSEFIVLMEHLHVIAPIFEDGDITKYFLPSALTHANLPPDSDEGSEVPPLLVTFKSGYCPRGVFGSLVVRLMKKVQEDLELKWKLKEDKIYRNQVQMSVGPYDSFRFHLQSRFIRIDLVFSSRERRGLTVGRVCCHVRQCVHESIGRVTEALNYSQKAAHTFAFVCPETSAEVHPATLNYVGSVLHNMECTMTGEGVPLPDGHQFWFDETKDVSYCGKTSTQPSNPVTMETPVPVPSGAVSSQPSQPVTLQPHQTEQTPPIYAPLMSPSYQHVTAAASLSVAVPSLVHQPPSQPVTPGHLESEHEIWLTEQVQSKPVQKCVPVSSPQILTDFVPLYDIPDDIVENSASLRWKLSDIHQRGINGEGIVIAILDDGINSNHNAFKQAKKECRINTANFVPGEDKTVYDCELSSHGTMAVFIAGGEGFSNVPCGVAPNASLLVARIGKNKVYSVAAVIAALEYLIKHRETKGEDSLHIVSMSFGMPYDPDDKDQETILRLILKLKSFNVVCVASAGNYGAYKGGILFPARSEDVISVGALTVKGYSSQSNAPTGIDVLAPGEYVPVPSASLSVKHSNKVESCSGSSCAAPAIAGLIALMMHYAKKCESKPEDRKKYHTLIYIKSQLEKMKADTILEPSRFFGPRLTEFENRLEIEKLRQMVEQLLQQSKQ